MASKNSFNSINSDEFFLGQLWNEQSLQLNKSRHTLSCLELSAIHTREMPTLSSVTSPEPDIATLDDCSNDPLFPFGFETQQPIVPPSLNNLNLPPKSFNILASMAVV